MLFRIWTKGINLHYIIRQLYLYVQQLLSRSFVSLDYSMITLETKYIPSCTSYQSRAFGYTCNAAMRILVVNNYYYISLRYHLGFTSSIPHSFRYFHQEEILENI